MHVIKFTFQRKNLSYSFWGLQIFVIPIISVGFKWLKVLTYSMLVAVQSLSHVQLFVIPGTVAYQSPLSSTISWSLLKFMLIDII